MTWSCCPDLPVNLSGVETKMSLLSGFNPVWSSNEDRASCLKVKGLLISYDYLYLTIKPVREGKLSSTEDMSTGKQVTNSLYLGFNCRDVVM